MVSILYNSPANPETQTNPGHGSNLTTTQGRDFVQIESSTQQNLFEYVEPSQPVIDFATTNIPNPLTSYSLSSTQHDIKDFLARPVLCPSTFAAWNLQTRGTILGTMSVPDALLSLPIYQQKVSGFRGFRGTLVLKLQTNAQKFQSGILLLSVGKFVPMLSAARRNTLESNIVPLSQLPSVRHNIATTNETTLRVPFTSYENAYSLITFNAQPYAKVYYTVYSSATNGPIVFKCWCHFEDVELLYPVAQSGRSNGTSRRAKFIQSDKEDSGGIISEPVKTISGGIRRLGDNIPLISSYTGPTSWFLDSLSKGLASFGLSNPVDTSTRHSFVPRIMSHANNIDVPDTLDSHGMFAANKIAHLDGFAGTNIDEMALQYFCAIPSFIGAFNISTTNTEGTSIYLKFVQPNTEVSATATGSGGPVSINWTSPMSYAAHTFAYWRGSIVYKFYAAKTTFHNARILFVYSPNPAILPTYADAHFNTRYIWDLSQTSEYEITVPYVNQAPYLPRNNWVGYLRAFVLNELEAPTNVSSTVEILVEERAGADFELAVPISPVQAPILVNSGLDIIKNHRKYKNLYISSKDEVVTLDKNKKSNLRDFNKNKKKNKNKIATQRRDKYSIYCQAPLEPSMGGPVEANEGAYINQTDYDTAGIDSLYTIGEVIKSIRQLLKRSQAIFLDQTPAAAVKTYVGSPTALTYSMTNVTANKIRPTNVLHDYYSYFGGCFGLYRGSMVMRYITYGQQQARAKSILYPSVSLWKTNFTGALTAVTVGMTNWIYSSPTIQGALDVHIPFYSPTHSLVNYHYGYAATDTGTTISGHIHNNLDIAISSTGTATLGCDILRQVGDDFSFGGFIGVLPLADLDNTTGVVPN